MIVDRVIMVETAHKAQILSVDAVAVREDELLQGERVEHFVRSCLAGAQCRSLAAHRLIPPPPPSVMDPWHDELKKWLNSLKNANPPLQHVFLLARGNGDGDLRVPRFFHTADTLRKFLAVR